MKSIAFQKILKKNFKESTYEVKIDQKKMFSKNIYVQFLFFVFDKKREFIQIRKLKNVQSKKK